MVGDRAEEERGTRPDERGPGSPVPQDVDEEEVLQGAGSPAGDVLLTLGRSTLRRAKAIPTGSLNSPGAVPLRPHSVMNTPWESNFWTRLFSESTTYTWRSVSTAMPRNPTI